MTLFVLILALIGVITITSITSVIVCNFWIGWKLRKLQQNEKQLTDIVNFILKERCDEIDSLNNTWSVKSDEPF